MPGGVFSTAKLHAMTIRESATDGSDFTNPDADYRRLFLGEDGKLHVKDSAGTVTDPYTGGSFTAVQASSVTGDGSGNLTNSTTGSWVDVTSASITFTTTARRVKLGFIGVAANDNASGLTSFTFDVDGSPQGGTLGLVRDQMDGTASRFRNVSFTFMTAALTAASHTFKVQWRVSTGTSTLLNASASAVWHFWAEECPT